MPPSVRTRVVQRLAVIYGCAVLAQAAAYLAAVWTVRGLLNALARLIATHAASGGATLSLTFFGTVFCVGLALALAIGFFGARWTLRAMRTAVPAHLPMPTAPVTWAALSAGVLIVCIESLVALSRLSVPTPIGIAFIVVRDALTVALLWYGALRSVRNPRGVALAAAVVQRGSSLTQRA